MKLDVNQIIDEVPVIDSSSDYWLMRANGGDFYTDFYMNSYIGLGWNGISTQSIKDANNNSDVIKGELKQLTQKNGDNPEDTSEQAYGIWANQLIRFTSGLKVNDIVVVPSESSELFLVGQITSDTFELAKDKVQRIQDETTQYKVSDFQKRRTVKWLGSFSRDKADTALYKMIYSQHTLSDINFYKPYINRAMFDAYIEDSQLHLTFNVTQSTDISSEYLGQFMYQISKIAKTFDSTSNVVVKVNVQSPGPVETVFKSVGIGMAVFAVIGMATALPYGGEFKFGNAVIGEISYKVPGIATSHQNNVQESVKSSDEHNEKLLKIEKDAVKQAVELKVPISKLGLNLPESIQKSLQQEVDRQVKKQAQKTDKKKKDDTSHPSKQ